MSITKDDLVLFLQSLKQEYVLKNLTNYGEQILYTLEYIHYQDVLNHIKKRQDSLAIESPNNFLAFYIPKNKTIDDIAYGCRCCLANKITHIRHSDKCNSNCNFCYFYMQSDDSRVLPYWAYRESSTRFNLDEDEMKLLLYKQIFNKVNAIGWLEKEPLMKMEKMKPIMKFISDNGIYQYLYTNGILANKDNLLMLKDWGLNEIRFNLQASDFSPAVLAYIRLAGTIIENVCIETPIYSKSFENFLKHKDYILDSGIKQINMPELQINPNNIKVFESEGQVYRHRRGYVSPVSSRHYVYDLIELAIKESWDCIINDCSNDTKFFRGVYNTHNSDINSGIMYETSFKYLPIQYYLDIVNQYVDVELEF